MAPRKDRRTTAANRSRNKGKAQGKVTGKTPTSRANRQKASNARVTKSGQGVVKGNGQSRMTTSSQRTKTNRARVTGTTRQRVTSAVRKSEYAKDIAKLRSLLRKGGAVALRQARSLARAIGPRALKAAPGLVVGGAIVGSAGRPNQRSMSKLGLLKAAEYNNPLDPQRRKPKPKPRQMANLPKDYKKTEAAAFKAAEKPRSGGGGGGGGSTRRSSGGGGSTTTRRAAAPKPKKDRMVGKSSAERLAVWAKANRTMIEKSGTKTQKAILAKALGKSKKPASKKGSTSPSSAIKPAKKGSPKPQKVQSVYERTKANQKKKK